MMLISIYIFIIIILLSLFIGYKIGNYYNEKRIKSKLKERKIISDQALLDYIYNHYEL
jgi:uncharacterized protein YneF (UPF0154 family)